MKYAVHELRLRDFFYFGVSATGITKLEEEIIPIIKSELLIKAYQELMNEFDKDYIISFEKIYWDDNKIQEAIDTELRIVSGMYAVPSDTPPYTERRARRDVVYDMVKNMKPYNLVLVIRNHDEYMQKREYIEQLDCKLKTMGVNIIGLSFSEKQKTLKEMNENERKFW